MGEYEEQRALIKEQKPRDLYGEKIEKCCECARLRKNWRTVGNNICSAMGFEVLNINEMHRMCALPLFEDRKQ